MNNIIKDKKMNFRDIGGIKNSDGKTVRDKIILRSGKLNKLSDYDAEVLTDYYKLKIIIDLRASSEKEGRADIVPQGVQYLEIPYFNESTMGMTSGMGSDVMSAVKKAKSRKELFDYVPDLDTVYPLMVSDDFSVSKISEALKIIMNNRDGSVLYHCTAGKDRTGVTTAILLKILGVSYDDIVSDYLKTNIVSKKNAVKYSRLAAVFLLDKKLALKIYRVFMAEKSYLDAAFKAIDDKFGSFDAFVADGLKLNADEIADFKAYALL